MPESPPSSNDSPRLSATPSDPGEGGGDGGGSVDPHAHASPTLPPIEWRPNLGLFLGTIASVFGTQVYYAFEAGTLSRGTFVDAALFTGTLLTILVAHELGHFIAARLHRVDATLPFFIPLPYLSPFGTMGAVIRMRGKIATRRALMDIGASGPLAGLLFAIPLYIWGVAHSTPVIVDALGDVTYIGESLATKVLDRFFGPHVPDGMELTYSPVAFAAWGGMFVTMINLIPVGQLDGGHVAYSLFGPRQNGFGRAAHRAMLVFFFVSLASYILRDWQSGFGFARLARSIQNSMFWLVWFEVLGVLGSLTPSETGDHGQTEDDAELSPRVRIFGTIGLLLVAGMARASSSPAAYLAWFVGLAALLGMERKAGTLRPHTLLDHPPTSATPLDPFRKAVAVVTLLLFVLLFMPTPFAM